jgi:TetR/AcrR family transcriptional regulator, transcriptional repressor for nem operon
MITRKGQATRDRIVAEAAKLMYDRGVAGTTTEDVQEAAGVSASQIYHYFGDKRSLTRAVIEYRTHAILGFQQPLLDHVNDVDALRRWADAVLDVQRANGFRGGCPLGSLAGELAANDRALREDLASSYRRWDGVIRDGLDRMKHRGVLAERTDVDALATTLLVTLQGGLLLAKTLHDGGPLETALNTVIDHLASFAPDAGEP